MLACEELTVAFNDAQDPILKNVRAVFTPGALNAVIGPSGCGKTTLVKAMLGILPLRSGSVYYGKDQVHSSEELTGRVGFTPQFTTAHEQLTVEEALSCALDLYVRDQAVKAERRESILKIIGLEAQRQTRVGSLSGGQLRRLGLGLELTTDPECMVCDEVTSGLDPRSEDQILGLLRELSRTRRKTFINIIHNLGKLDYFDNITVVYEGDVIFQGTLKELKFYFNLNDPLHLYDVLHGKSLEHWQRRWQEYSKGMHFRAESKQPVVSPILPSACSQVVTLLRRRMRLFLRDRTYLLMTLAITFGFPMVVTLFALDGLPAIEGLALDASGQGFMERMRHELAFRMESAKTASLVTGLIMFQVILLTLMASNNGAREIAAERNLYEKERLNGLRSGAYGVAKMLFVSLLALVQGVLMTVVVKQVCEFPGPFGMQTLLLCLCCVSMTFVCLGFSAMLGTSEKASLLSIYLVGFQLPLSGVVLALPDALVWVFRPFINAYWSWSGYVSTMVRTPLYDSITMNEPERYLASPEVGAVVLVIQALVGAVMVFWGCQMKRWE